MLLAQSDYVISWYFEIIILFYPISLPNNKDFLFYPVTQANRTLLAYIIDYKTMKFLVKNTSNWLLCIARRQKLDYAINIYYDNCFLNEIESIFHIPAFPPKILPFFKHELFCILMPTNLFIETQLDNSVKIYGDEQTLIVLAQLVTKYLSI